MSVNYFRAWSRHCITIATVTTMLLLVNKYVSAKTYEDVRLEHVQNCDKKYKNKTIPPAQLKVILDHHKTVINKSNSNNDYDFFDPNIADLCGANLIGADLRGVNLSHARLTAVNLSNADLTGAILYDATMRFANLDNANLSGADLRQTRLNNTSLFHTNLSGANMQSAYITSANLVDANLDSAKFFGAFLRNTHFQPSVLPQVDLIAYANGLEYLRYTTDPQALVKLRKAFNDAGYQQQAKRITNALRSTEYAQFRPYLYENKYTIADYIEDLFKLIFFELPTQWGLYPGRALRILIVLIGFFALPYTIAMRYPGHGRIYRKWGVENRPVSTTTSTWRATQRNTHTLAGTIELLQYPWFKSLRRGLQFSLLSAFHIGFRELNVGNWISRLQSRDYTLYATGWVRSVSGIQSLISVYLLAMWALTYFGRPFD